MSLTTTEHAAAAIAAIRLVEDIDPQPLTPAEHASIVLDIAAVYARLAQASATDPAALRAAVDKLDATITTLRSTIDRLVADLARARGIPEPVARLQAGVDVPPDYCPQCGGCGRITDDDGAPWPPGEPAPRRRAAEPRSTTPHPTTCPRCRGFGRLS